MYTYAFFHRAVEEGSPLAVLFSCNQHPLPLLLHNSSSIPQYFSCVCLIHLKKSPGTGFISLINRLDASRHWVKKEEDSIRTYAYVLF